MIESNTINLRIVRNKKGTLYGETTFPHGVCHLHPIPKKLQQKVEEKRMENQVVTGYFTSVKEAPVKDRTGNIMYIEPFIPLMFKERNSK